MKLYYIYLFVDRLKFIQLRLDICLRTMMYNYVAINNSKIK